MSCGVHSAFGFWHWKKVKKVARIWKMAVVISMNQMKGRRKVEFVEARMRRMSAPTAIFPSPFDTMESAWAM